MNELLQSTAKNEMVFLVLSSDSKTGATGKTLTIEISKNGEAFASIISTATERGFGWYSIALSTSNTDTLGDLAFHITAADCDPVDFKRVVVAQTGGLKNVHAKTIETVSSNALLGLDAFFVEFQSMGRFPDNAINEDVFTPAAIVAIAEAVNDGTGFTGIV